MKRTKRFKKIDDIIKDVDLSTVDNSIDLLKSCPEVKFDQSVELSLHLGVDPKKNDQQVRGTVTLPNGTGKKTIVVAIAKGDKVKEALDAGADYAGSDDLIEKIKGGWTDFDSLVVTPDLMREVGKLGKILGPRGLMPSPKAGTVTKDVGKAVKEVKAGKVEYKIDKNACINNSVGKISFSKEAIIENVHTILSAIHRAKPATAKGVYMKALTLATTMGPGVKIDLSSLTYS